MSLDERIKAFASLVGLVLVLITLFTNQRASAVRELATGPSGKREDANQELGLDGVLLVFTVLLFVAGLPLVCDALHAFHPRSSSGPLRSAFVISWSLLLGLIAWQILLIKAAFGLRSALPSRNA